MSDGEQEGTINRSKHIMDAYNFECVNQLQYLGADKTLKQDLFRSSQLISRNSKVRIYFTVIKPNYYVCFETNIGNDEAAKRKVLR